MKILQSVKYFTCYAIGSTVLLLILYISMIKRIPQNRIKVLSFGIENHVSNFIDTEKKNNGSKVFYILQWTSPKNVPFVYMGKGREGFIKRKCPHTNCFVTSNRTLLKDLTKFDAIVFSGPEVILFKYLSLPQYRLPHQKYVFASIESPVNYPVCSNRFDNFFNWTWTYKLDSDARWGYIIIRDARGNIVGPSKEMHWIKKEKMQPVSESIINILRGKTKTAAWLTSNCVTSSNRGLYVAKLKKKLKKIYNLTIDVYGSCGNLICSRNNEEKCDEMIRKDYHFYLAFENALSEDYVTEKLLHAVQYNAIPIVFGGANYSRFLPEGSYLNTEGFSFKKLAAKINELIHNFEKYSYYFRWTRYYSYHKQNSAVETNDLCGFCALLNNEEKIKQETVYDNFSLWWDEDFC